MNVISSQRALGYANHFKKFGFDPTIVTYDWSKKIENQYCLEKEFFNEVRYEENDKYKVCRLPLVRKKRAKVLASIENSKLSKIGVFIAWMFGHLDTTSNLLDFKYSERKFLKLHLKENNYDIILGIFSPHFHLSNCCWAEKKFGVRYALDYRDLWSNHLTIEDYSFDSAMRFKIKIFNYYWKKWNNNSTLQSITSDPWLKKLDEITRKNGVVVTNGFERDGTIALKSELINPAVFTIAHTGTIYPEQEFEFMLKGIQEFFKSKIGAKCIVLFVGLNFAGENERNRVLVLKYLKADQFIITKRLPRENVIYIQQNAQILIFPTTLLIPGTYSGKIFEYIHSGVNILAGPKDQGAVCDLLTKTNTGTACDTVDEVNLFLLKNYNKWERSESIELEANVGLVNEYSRENQTNKIANYLKEKLKS